MTISAFTCVGPYAILIFAGIKPFSVKTRFSAFWSDYTEAGAIFCANVTILEAKRIKRVGRRSISSGVAYGDVGKRGGEKSHFGGFQG